MKASFSVLQFAVLGTVLALPQQDAVPTSDPCTTTSFLPTATVTYAGGYYEQCYTLTYDKWCDTGLCPQAYTITQTCGNTICRGPTETALPPGFTRAAVACSACGGRDGEVVTETLIFPVESEKAWKESGYVIETIAEPTEEPKACYGESCEQNQDYERPVVPKPEETHVVVEAGATTLIVSGVGLGALIGLVALM